MSGTSDNFSVLKNTVSRSSAKLMAPAFLAFCWCRSSKSLATRLGVHSCRVPSTSKTNFAIEIVEFVSCSDCAGPDDDDNGDDAAAPFGDDEDDAVAVAVVVAAVTVGNDDGDDENAVAGAVAGAVVVADGHKAGVEQDLR